MTNLAAPPYILTSAGWQSVGHDSTDPPGSGQTMLLGANEPGISSWSAWSSREAVIGTMGVRRSYDTGFNTDYTAGPCKWEVGHPVTSYTSFRPSASAVVSGSLDPSLRAWANSVPVGKSVMLSPWHEPEDNTGTTSAATWRTGMIRMYDVIKEVRPDILIGPTLMAWTFDPKSGRNPQDWNIAGHCDFYGVDYYNPYHYPKTGNTNNWVNPIATPVVNFANFCDSVGVPGAVGEIASSEDQTGIGPQRKIDWTAAYIDYAHTKRFLAFAWFDSYKPGDTDPSMVIDSTPEFTGYWKSQCTAHPARGF